MLPERVYWDRDVVEQVGTGEQPAEKELRWLLRHSRRHYSRLELGPREGELREGQESRRKGGRGGDDGYEAVAYFGMVFICSIFRYVAPSRADKWLVLRPSRFSSLWGRNTVNGPGPIWAQS